MSKFREMVEKYLKEVNLNKPETANDSTEETIHVFSYPKSRKVRREQKQIIKQKLPKIREKLIQDFELDKHNGIHLAGLMPGREFEDDDRVIAKVAWLNGTEFTNKKPTDDEVIYNALKTCAENDYWYAYEKEW